MSRVWQLLDSAFPTGGFAHSSGLEAAVQHGEVTTDASLRQFVRASVENAAHSSLPLLSAVHRAPERLDELDALCDAFLTNAVANRASRVQGRALLTACVRVWPSDDLAAIERRARRLCGHHAPMAGAVLRALDVPLVAAQRILLFVTCRGVLAAGVRLGVVGPYRAQRIQAESAGDLERALERCASLGVDRLAQAAPLVDLLQSTHDRLYSRLFQS
jgi:urease accessory protein